MHPVILQAYANAVAADRQSRRTAARDPRRRAPGPGVSLREGRSDPARAAAPPDRAGPRSLTSRPWSRSASSSASPSSPPTAPSIRELAGVPSGNAANQSLAEATVPPGGETAEHYHRVSEEIYFFLSGVGTMRLGDDEAAVRGGDCVVIPPGAVHKLFNPGTEPLVLLCCCSPAYSARGHRPPGGERGRRLPAPPSRSAALLLLPAAASATPRDRHRRAEPGDLPDARGCSSGVPTCATSPPGTRLNAAERGRARRYLLAARAADRASCSSFGRSRDPQPAHDGRR